MPFLVFAPPEHEPERILRLPESMPVSVSEERVRRHRPVTFPRWWDMSCNVIE